MNKQNLAQAVIDYLAKNRKGSRDMIDIFGFVMDPSPQHPRRWAEMTAVLEEMRRDSLVQMSTQFLESRRIAIFYQLTAKGWTAARPGRTADESRG